MGQTWEKELSQSGMSAEYIEVRFTIRNKTKKCIHCKIVTVKYNLFSSIFHNRIHWFWDQSDPTTQKDPFIRLRVRDHLRRKFKIQFDLYSTKTIKLSQGACRCSLLDVLYSHLCSLFNQCIFRVHKAECRSGNPLWWIPELEEGRLCKK